MRLLMFQAAGGPALGVRLGEDVADIAATDGRLPRDIFALIEAGPEAMAAVRSAAERSRIRIPTAMISHCVPIPRPEKNIGLGLNYLQHIREMAPEMAPPEFPGLFMRVPSSMVAHRAAIVRPAISDTLDYEGELMAVIGRPGRHIPVERALDHVFGYTCHNDGSIREYNRRAVSLTAGKNFDSTGGIGPEIVTADELPPGCAGLRLRTRVNGEIRQAANLSDMNWRVAELVSMMSRMMTLRPGDLLATGTPAGVGKGFDPPRYLRPGDLVDVEIEAIGVLTNPVIDEPETSSSAGPTIGARI